MLDLSKEFNEVKNAFKEGNTLTRIVMVMGFFLLLSSMAELSGKIVAWKGFILDGLKFYHSIFVEPVTYLSSHIGLNYTELEIHVATVSSICISIGMRVQIMGQKVAFRNISERYGNEVKPNLAFFWVVGIIAPIGIWLWYGFKEPTIYTWWVIFVSIFLPLFMIVPKVILSKLGDYEFFEKGSFSYFKSYYIYISSVLLIICILAAINSGLKDNRKMPNKSIQPTVNVAAD
ncbi:MULTISPECIES: heme transporter CcmC [unclassified Pseudoalteromonas]|uniref:heme transporter CcmC n=1 Tax=unclassified Pseudoalteromonas TaxID=194690 RepID=UPI0016003E2D|nr:MULTISPECIES: heme transporter CcmC [unclassified Pseudoalteromonas]MBB1332760.1 heme transporter CcmC [Pseudoalteromonas sp. SR41-6]MBB1459270.1 heme transporter CcmC [Pseudoalteromonas sp. SG41-8]